MKKLAIDSFVFDHPGDYYLVQIRPDGEVRTDGGHSTPAGVAKARELIETIACIKPPEGTIYRMIKVEEVPKFKGRTNKSAISLLNDAYLEIKKSGVHSNAGGSNT